MRKILMIFCLILLIYTTNSYSEINTYFSPNGTCTDNIILEINDAKINIYVQAYSFTSVPIAQALVRASERGVYVIIILDRGQPTARSSMINYVASNKIITYVDKKHAIAHNKIIIVDQQVLLTGSFNFTKNAEFKNAENLLIIKDEPKVIDEYLKNFQHHQEHSTLYLN